MHAAMGCWLSSFVYKYRGRVWVDRNTLLETQKESDSVTQLSKSSKEPRHSTSFINFISHFCIFSLNHFLPIFKTKTIKLPMHRYNSPCVIYTHLSKVIPKLPLMGALSYFYFSKSCTLGGQRWQTFQYGTGVIGSDFCWAWQSVLWCSKFSEVY